MLVMSRLLSGFVGARALVRAPAAARTPAPLTIHKGGLFRRSAAGYRARSFSAAPAATTQITTLSNGMRVATEPNASQTAAVGVFINTGSVYENQKNNGAAHFLEHMAFKVRAVEAKEAREVVREMSRGMREM